MPFHRERILKETGKAPRVGHCRSEVRNVARRSQSLLVVSNRSARLESCPIIASFCCYSCTIRSGVNLLVLFFKTLFWSILGLLRVQLYPINSHFFWKWNFCSSNAIDYSPTKAVTYIPSSTKWNRTWVAASRAEAGSLSSSTSSIGMITQGAIDADEGNEDVAGRRLPGILKLLREWKILKIGVQKLLDLSFPHTLGLFLPAREHCEIRDR